MRVRQLSKSGDYTFGQGVLNFYVDIPATVGQVVKTSLLLWIGEWYLDLSQGVPYPTGVLGKTSQIEANTTIQDAVLNTQGVVDIASFSSVLAPSTRAYSCEMTINTQYGTTEVQMQNYLSY